MLAEPVNDSQTFCSHPAQICAQNTSVTGSQMLSQTYAYIPVDGMPPVNVTCQDNATLRISGTVASPGMAFELLARVASDGGSVACSGASVFNASATTNATIAVSGAQSMSIIWAGGTNYDMDAGDAAYGFSFQGVDPHDALVDILNAASAKAYTDLLAEHITDYTAVLHNDFALDLGGTPDLSTPTDQLKAQYEVDTGNPYLEWLLFNFGRHMLASAARGTLPANLQGKWADVISNAWDSDYREQSGSSEKCFDSPSCSSIDANINLQMSYWSAESTNLNITQSLWDYMQVVLPSSFLTIHADCEDRKLGNHGASTLPAFYTISAPVGWFTIRLAFSSR